ncbi:uncharacterized protein LOC120811222 isoform X1 [Gasterosteus aculeatus]
MIPSNILALENDFHIYFLLFSEQQSPLIHSLLEPFLKDFQPGSEKKVMSLGETKVEAMASLIELLLETVMDLTSSEFKRFQQFLLNEIDFDRPSSDFPWRLLSRRDKQDTVFLMVLSYGQQSLTMIKEHLKYFERTDLKNKLPPSSPGPKKKSSKVERPALIQKVATMAAVKQVLLETVTGFRNKELQKFKELLQLIVSQREHQWIWFGPSDAADTVDEMMQTYGRRSLDLTREVMEKMNRSDLMQKLSASSLGLTEEPSVEKHHAALSKQRLKIQTAAVEMSLLPKVKALSIEEFEKFKWLLQFTYFKKSLPNISWSTLEWAETAYQLVVLMEHKPQSLEVTEEVLMDMRIVPEETLPETSWGLKELGWKSSEEIPISSPIPSKSRRYRTTRYRNIKQCWSEKVLKEMESSLSSSNTSSGFKEPSRSCESISDSGEWTQLEPEEDRKGTDEAPTYSLQSEAGSFECSVSGLRWICNGTVSFKYQFLYMGSHEVLMERIRSLQYMPAGPLMDITVIAGKFDEVYLRHWICIENNPEILDKFAVLHIEDCGDDVEKVSQVTLSHVKLSEPVFSLKMLLVRWGCRFEVDCNVLIYKTNTDFLTLHVYLIPRDLGLQQELDKRMLSYGYKLIRKPHPEKSLKMKDCFILTADLEKAEISPETLMLRYESTDPNFFEVFIDNPETNFKLKLSKENESQAVWTCAIRKDVYQSTAGAAGVNTPARDGSAEKHFVDKHRTALINRVTNVAPILDDLIDEEVISKGHYDEIMALTTRRDRMRELCDLLDGSGRAGKDLFYKILEKKEKFLMKDLQKKE